MKSVDLRKMKGQKWALQKNNSLKITCTLPKGFMKINQKKKYKNAANNE
jgi:hypothetical protein